MSGISITEEHMAVRYGEDDGQCVYKRVLKELAELKERVSKLEKCKMNYSTKVNGIEFIPRKAR